MNQPPRRAIEKYQITEGGLKETLKVERLTQENESSPPVSKSAPNDVNLDVKPNVATSRWNCQNVLYALIARFPRNVYRREPQKGDRNKATLKIVYYFPCYQSTQLLLTGMQIDSGWVLKRVQWIKTIYIFNTTYVAVWSLTKCRVIAFITVLGRCAVRSSLRGVTLRWIHPAIVTWSRSVWTLSDTIFYVIR